jgi:hypothetical protein
MSGGVERLHDSKNLLHECVHRLHVSVDRSPLNFGTIAS